MAANLIGQARKIPISLYAVPKVTVKKFVITGNIVFPKAELAKVTVPYENREIGFAELQALRQQLTLYYVEHGNINSCVIITDQEIVDDTVTLSVIEGTISEIEIC